MSATAGPRSKRKDAQRNRTLVLDAAHKVFSAKGLGASLDEIADEAGVGVGTAHRAFGSKSGLIDALYERIVDETVGMLDACGREPSGWIALRSAVWELTKLQIENRALHALLYRSADPKARRLRQRIEPVLTAIIRRAREEGAVRGDFAATDIPVFTRAISGVAVGVEAGDGERIARRQVEIFLKGIAATPDAAPIARPLRDDEFAGWLGALPGR